MVTSGGDFGGGKEGAETPFQTALREGCEELNGFLGCGGALRKLVADNRVGEVHSQTHRTYLFQIQYDTNLPRYFNNHYKFIKKHIPIAVNNRGFFESPR